MRRTNIWSTDGWLSDTVGASGRARPAVFRAHLEFSLARLAHARKNRPAPENSTTPKSHRAKTGGRQKGGFSSEIIHRRNGHLHSCHVQHSGLLGFCSAAVQNDRPEMVLADRLDSRRRIGQ